MEDKGEENNKLLDQNIEKKWTKADEEDLALRKIGHERQTKLEGIETLLGKDAGVYDMSGKLTEEGKEGIITQIEAIDDALNSIDEFNFVGKKRENLLLELQNKSVDLQDILRNKSDWKGPPKPRFSTGGIANNTLAMLLE